MLQPTFNLDLSMFSLLFFPLMHFPYSYPDIITHTNILTVYWYSLLFCESCFINGIMLKSFSYFFPKYSIINLFIPMYLHLTYFFSNNCIAFYRLLQCIFHIDEQIHRLQFYTDINDTDINILVQIPSQICEKFLQTYIQDLWFQELYV